MEKKKAKNKSQHRQRLAFQLYQVLFLWDSEEMSRVKKKMGIVI